MDSSDDKAIRTLLGKCSGKDVTLYVSGIAIKGKVGEVRGSDHMVTLEGKGGPVEVRTDRIDGIAHG